MPRTARATPASRSSPHQRASSSATVPSSGVMRSAASATAAPSASARPSRARATRRSARAMAAARSGRRLSRRRGRLPAAVEDCLFLNIWTTGPRPAQAQAGDGLYPRRRLFERQRHRSAQRRHARSRRAAMCVVVTVNHRLNAFGYLYLARLDPRFADSGNAGQLDLILALQMGARQYRRVRRRSSARHGVRPVGRRREDRDDDGHARRQGPVPPRGDDERAAGHRIGSAQRDRRGRGPISASSA